jgi:hypothetical protein
MAVGLAVFGALTLVTLGASSASASDRVHGFSTEVGSMKVSVFSQMCDGGGPPLHTRLAVKNNASSAQQIVVHDVYASKAVYDPPGPIAPGKGTLIHLTSKRGVPSHSITIAANGQTGTMTVPEDPCPVDPPTTDPTTDTTKPTGTTKPTTPTTKGTTQTTGGAVIPPDPGDPGTPGGVVSSPGVVAVGASVGANTAAKAATTGTLPFTGSDIRGYALLGNLLVLLGFAMLIISHRSPRAAAFFKRMRPSRAA